MICQLILKAKIELVAELLLRAKKPLIISAGNGATEAFTTAAANIAFNKKANNV
ncbi:MAG: hypothetical protein ACEY3J_01970 [Arsenophonus sp.]